MLAGSRQVGKTTLAGQAARRSGLPTRHASADEPDPARRPVDPAAAGGRAEPGRRGGRGGRAPRARRSASALGSSDAEFAFYDALGVNDSAVQVLGDETLRAIARELVETVRGNVTIDWTLRENVRAN